MRERIEILLAAWGHFSYRHAWSLLVGVTLTVAAGATQLPKLTLDTSTESFLHEGDPLRVAYDAFREQFGRDDQVVVAIEALNIYTPAFLDRLRSMHEDIENEVPNLEEVSSLINARSTVGDGDRLIVGELLEDRPESPEEWAEIERLARANPMYRNLLVSEDGRFATILVRTSAYSSLDDAGDELSGFDEEESRGEVSRAFITGEENSAIVTALSAIQDRYDADDFRIYMAGTPVMIEAMQLSMRTDMARFGTLSMLVIAGFLALLFRKVAGVVLPMLTVILSVASTLSVMAAAGVPISLPTQILPSFLLAIGVGYAVHLLAIYYQQRRVGAEGEDAMAHALGHSGLAIVMTSLTTAGGLVSFAAAELAPIASFGIFAPLGVLIALLFTLVFLPALTAVFPMGSERGADGRSDDRISQRLLIHAGDFATSHAWSVTLATAGLAAIALL
ncbi:MAG: RND family transporter, partial [Myxococcota bacterium]